MFVEDEAKFASRVDGVERGVVYFSRLLFESIEEEFSLRGVIVISTHCIVCCLPS